MQCPYCNSENLESFKISENKDLTFTAARCNNCRTIFKLQEMKEKVKKRYSVRAYINGMLVIEDEYLGINPIEVLGDIADLHDIDDLNTKYENAEKLIIEKIK